MQKAIRRGDAKIACRAATNLLHHDPRALWRRLIVIAFEDVGAGDLDALIEVTALATDRTARARFGSDLAAVMQICRRLADATKDRCTDLAISCARFDPGLEAMRETCGSVSIADRIALATRVDLPLAARAVAAWYASGLEWQRSERRVGRGDLDGLLGAFGDMGAPAALLDATRAAAKRTGEPITVLVPVIWLNVARGETSARVDAIETPKIERVPLAALDGHTRIGREAIRRFGQENRTISNFVIENVPDFRSQRALQLATFFADSARISKKLVWHGSEQIEADGIAADFIGAGVEPDVGGRLVALVRANLDHLNAIRAELLTKELTRTHGGDR